MIPLIKGIVRALKQTSLVNSFPFGRSRCPKVHEIITTGLVCELLAQSASVSLLLADMS